MAKSVDQKCDLEVSKSETDLVVLNIGKSKHN